VGAKGIADFSKTAVVERAGTVMLNEFELTVTEFDFNALLVCDTKVSVDGSDDNCSVEALPLAGENPFRFTVTLRDEFISRFTIITVIESAA
jgi:hypothetical protein